MLTCTHTFHDTDLADSDMSVVAWTVGGVPAGVGSTLSGVFAAGDTVTCTVVPNDGSVAGTAASASVVIENMTPQASQVQVVSATDADGDGDP